MFLALLPSAFAAVFQGNGFKIGEVTANSVVIWTRLTTRPEANWSGAPFVMPNVERAVQTGNFDWHLQLPSGKTLADMQGALPGAAGEVRVTLRPATGGAPIERGWTAVESQHDYTRQFAINALKPETRYKVTVESRDASGTAGPTLEGGFATAPIAGRVTPVQFVVVTCGDYPRRDDLRNGHTIYRSMLKLSPAFLVHTGDVEYFDKADPIGNSPELARFKFNRLFALPFQRSFHLQVPAYFMCDDHDVLKNDCWPGQNYGSLTFAEGSRIFREQMPKPTAQLYRTVRWGRDLQFWMMEGREFRSPNNMPDGAQKTIWGAEQKQWLFRTVAASDATFKILITPTPIVGPDRGNKGDSHANAAFRTEGDEVRRFIGGRKDMVVMNGDRHWQYASVHPQTGVREFGCGPSSDVHAGGYTPQPGDERIQKFFRLKGGFLSVEIKRVNDRPVMLIRHHDVQGAVVHESIIDSARR
ncbi:MAG: alkaline phosphatase D family protein [Opitutaceae bacterium]|nr:alkaline phosphatase D family protein [Opitutaceae bacterium]